MTWLQNIVVVVVWWYHTIRRNNDYCWILSSPLFVCRAVPLGTLLFTVS